MKMSSIIPFPFKCYPVPRNAYEEFWNSEQLRTVFEMFSTTPLNGRNQKWFAHRRSLEFLKSEARLKRRCGQVTPGVLADVERLLRQLCGSLAINGQCTVSNLKRVLMNQGLCSNGPKPSWCSGCTTTYKLLGRLKACLWRVLKWPMCKMSWKMNRTLMARILSAQSV